MTPWNNARIGLRAFGASWPELGPFATSQGCASAQSPPRQAAWNTRPCGTSQMRSLTSSRCSQPRTMWLMGEVPFRQVRNEPERPGGFDRLHSRGATDGACPAQGPSPLTWRTNCTYSSPRLPFVGKISGTRSANAALQREKLW